MAKTLRGRRVQLKIRDTDFKTETRQRMLAEPTRVADLCEQLVADYAVERATCEGEVRAFLTELKEEGLIRVVEDGD